MEKMNPANRWLLGTVAAATVAIVATWEGKSNDPYFDIVGVRTVCYGETNTAMRRYSDAECKAMLKASLTKYGDGLLQCVNVPISQNQHAAFTSFAYNVGVSTFCKSSVVRKLNAGDREGACKAMGLYVYAGGKFVRGLENRRKDEVQLCLS